MKKASTLISVIIAIVVLLAALGVGFGVKRFRVQRAEDAIQAKAEPEAKESGAKAALPGGGEGRRPVGLSDEKKGERQEARAEMNEKVENMSEEERREFMADRRDRFDGGERWQRGGGRRQGGMMGGMSDEERQAMRERYENMSEEERQQAMEEMRARFGGRRRGDRGGGGRRPPDGEPMRGDEGEEMTEENQDNPPDN